MQRRIEIDCALSKYDAEGGARCSVRSCGPGSDADADVRPPGLASVGVGSTREGRRTASIRQRPGLEKQGISLSLRIMSPAAGVAIRAS